jgi:hypothetical protein
MSFPSVDSPIAGERDTPSGFLGRNGFNPDIVEERRHTDHESKKGKPTMERDGIRNEGRG